MPHAKDSTFWHYSHNLKDYVQLPHEDKMGKAEVEAAQAMLGIIPPASGSAVGDGVVLVCVDCEAYEMAQHKITEVGVSVLDTRTVRDVRVDHCQLCSSTIANRPLTALAD